MHRPGLLLFAGRDNPRAAALPGASMGNPTGSWTPWSRQHRGAAASLASWSFGVNKSPRLAAEAGLFMALEGDKLDGVEPQNWRWCFLILGGEDRASPCQTPASAGRSPLQSRGNRKANCPELMAHLRTEQIFDNNLRLSPDHRKCPSRTIIPA